MLFYSTKDLAELLKIAIVSIVGKKLIKNSGEVMSLEKTSNL
jgi:hypothetical protein